MIKINTIQTQEQFIKYVDDLVEGKIRKYNLLKPEWSFGIVDEIIDSYSANIIMVGSTTPQRIPTNPNIQFIVGEQVIVVSFNHDSKNRYVIAKCATGTEQTGGGSVSGHDPVTVLDSNTIDFSLLNQQITGSVKTQMSITSDFDGIKLSGDSATPGNLKYYGTDVSGNKGYYTFPESGGAVDSVNGQTGEVVLTTADIADSSNKRYVTDAQLTVIGNTSGINSGNETTTTIGTLINEANGKTTPVDADAMPLIDSGALNVLKKVTWANIKTTLNSYFDTIYSTLALGETPSTAYRGDHGKIAYDHSQSAHAPSDAISKTNTDTYTPSANYHPATKKYVDDAVSQAGGGDMMKSQYDTDGDGKVNAADYADSVPWSGVSNRPTIPTALSELTDDSLHRTVTDTEKSTWNGKQNALGFTPENVANKGAANGYAGLDVSGKVPAAQLPSFVDDVLEYANLSSFPITGESGIIYVALDTNKTYRWSGSGYVEISQSLALGETSSTAYPGDKGKIAYDHSQSAHAPADAISKTNTDAYTPTANYHPATKKYVDDAVSQAGGGDMLKATYDTDDDGSVDKADAINGIASAGNSKYYGTDSSGTPGFHDLPNPGGVGVPTGGTTGQVLAKKSNVDYDTEWADPSGGIEVKTGASEPVGLVEGDWWYEEL